ncbi:MAG: hypothetical protein LAO08_20730 [Acidobacteriia bacterium]|nr:hypothetical protein [Terriglobia bacterium]
MEDELKILRWLCDEAVSREERSRLIESHSSHAFLEAEHQVVFESIQALFPRGPISAARLIGHLTNRGFPDVDAAKYLPGPRA